MLSWGIKNKVKNRSKDKTLNDDIEKIQKELVQSLLKKGLEVSKITISIDSQSLNINVYIDENAYNYC